MTTIRGPSLFWSGAVAAAVFVEIVILRTTSARLITPHVPLWADQVQYLTEAYRGHELIRDHGLLLGTVDAIRQPRVQGWLLQTVASFYMLIVGPSRLAALDVNLGLMLLWLVVTSYAVKRAFGVTTSLLALGLLLSTGTVINGPGGPFDFRLDFAATCLWGMLVILLAVADGREGWTLRAAILALGVLLIGTRLISSFYLLPFGGTVILLTVLPCRTHERSWWRSSGWVVPVVGIWLAVFGAILAPSFELFSGYYIRGHVTGEEVAVRRIADGLLRLNDDVAYYPRLLRDVHLGMTFLWLSALLLVVSCVSMLPVQLLPRGLRPYLEGPAGPSSGAPANSASGTDADRQEAQRLRWFLIVAMTGFLVPYLVLTANQQKNGPVAGVLVPPIALFVLGVVLWSGRRSWRTCRDSPRLIVGLAARGISALVVVAALNAQWERVQVGPGLPTPPTLQAYDQIVHDATPYLTEMSGRPITWSIDGHYVEISYSTVAVLIYERTGQWPNLVGGLGYGALEQRLDAADLLQAAECSDVLILSKHPPSTKMPYPYDQSIQDHHDVLEGYAQSKLAYLGSYDTKYMLFQLYVRPHDARAYATGGAVETRWRGDRGSPC